MSSLFISVVTSQPDSVPAYLYSHTSVVDTKTLGDRYGGRLTGMVLETTADDPDRCRFLADYQAQRLESGLHGAKVHESRERADWNLEDFA